MNNFFNKYINKLKSPRFLIIIGLLGIVLIFLSSLFADKKPEQPEECSNDVISASKYKELLEDDIKTLIYNITGSKKASVVITLESSVNYSYADTKQETSSEKSQKEETSEDYEIKQDFITIKNADGSEQALLVCAQMPEIRGVAIVCDGGDSEIICEKIENAVTAALNITAKRVYICGRKQ